MELEVNLKSALKMYHEITEASSPKLLEIKIDLDRALSHADLTNEEAALLRDLYFLPSAAPFRTGAAGAPKGGTTQGSLAGYSGQMAVTRSLRNAYSKMVQYLGEGYVTG